MKRNKLISARENARNRRLPVPLEYVNPVGEILAYWRVESERRHRVLSTIDTDTAQTALMRVLERKPDAVVQMRVIDAGPEKEAEWPAWYRVVPIRALDVVVCAGGWKRLAELVAQALRKGQRLIDPSWESRELQAEWSRETWSTAERADEYEQWWNLVQNHGEQQLRQASPKWLATWFPTVLREWKLAGLHAKVGRDEWDTKLRIRREWRDETETLRFLYPDEEPYGGLERAWKMRRRGR